jgi:hypothetical protein
MADVILAILLCDPQEEVSRHKHHYGHPGVMIAVS